MKHNNTGRMFGVILVGQSNGLRRIRWGVVCLLGCAVGIFSGAVALAVYFALSGTFSPPAAMIGFFGPFITVGTGVQRALKLHVEELPPLNG
jgi:hypothetical protein